MSTLAEIEVAVAQLPRAQQEELHAFLSTQLEKHPKRGLTPEEFKAWIKTAEGVGISGMTTDEIMAMTRGEE